LHRWPQDFKLGNRDTLIIRLRVGQALPGQVVVPDNGGQPVEIHPRCAALIGMEGER